MNRNEARFSFSSLPSKSLLLCLFLLRTKKTAKTSRKPTIPTPTTIPAIKPVLFFFFFSLGSLLLTVGVKSVQNLSSQSSITRVTLEFTKCVTWDSIDRWNRRSICTLSRNATSPLSSPKEMDIKEIFCYLNLKFPLYSLIHDSACCLLYVKILQNTTSLEYQGKNFR